MSKAVPSLLLFGIKQEEVNIEGASLLSPGKRPCDGLAPQHEAGSSESDRANSGNEWHPSPRPTSSTFSNEAKTPLFPPSAASTVPTDQLNVANRLSSCTTLLTTAVVITPNTSEIQHPKCEPEDPYCMKPTNESEGDSCLSLHSHACDICGRKFARSQHVKRHIDCLHKELRQFVCEFCGNAFAQRSQMKNHISAIHEEIREFVCESCGKAFAQRKDMKAHIITVHQGLRPYACEICGSGFGQLAHLKMHINRLHKNLRDFTCEVCGKAFAQNAEVQRHIKTVHKNMRDFACEFCGRAFAEKSNMKKHIKTVHGEPTEK